MIWGVFLDPRIITFDIIPHGEKIDFWKSFDIFNTPSQNPFKNVCKVNSKENVVKKKKLKIFFTILDFHEFWSKNIVFYMKKHLFGHIFSFLTSDFQYLTI